MAQNRLKLKHPIVLIHGLGARNTYGPVEYFYGLSTLLRDAGNTFIDPKLTAFHSMQHRATELKRQIEKKFPEGKVNLIAHSFGGLDARYLVSRLGFADRVASVTTIGTPNRGTVVCDIAMGLMPDVAFQMAEWTLSFLKSSGEPYNQMTTKYCNETLTQKAVDAPGVAYFSATSVIRDPVYRTSLPLFWIPHRIIKRYEGENDGFVSVHSAKYGTHICTYIGDHYGQIGQFVGFSRGLNYLKFYEEIITRLHKEGF
jgi:triacylglycerol lipase